MRKLYYMLVVAMLSCWATAFSQNKTIAVDSLGELQFTYRIGQNTPDMSLRSNKDNLVKLIKELKVFATSGDSLLVNFTYFCAPTGINAINKGVGETRSNVLIKDLKAHTNLPDSAFCITDGAAGWGELCDILEGSDIDNAGEIVKIIEKFPAERLKKIKKIDNGKTYSMLHESVFPKLRERVNVTFGTPAAVRASLAGMRSFELGLYRANGGDSCGVYCACTPPIQKVVEKIVYVPVNTDAPDHSYAGDFALKTNLIYDFITVPSIEIEYRFHKNWSANVEYDMAWWKNKSKNKSFEIAIASPEVRYWFNSVSPMKGYYVGAFPGYTWFDLENGGTGHRGYGVFGGISFGMSHPITSQLAFEAGLGIGYMNLRYKDYEPFDDHHVYSREKSTGYFGPLKIKFAIVWHPWGGSTSKAKVSK